MGRHPAADAALFLCVFGRWVGCAYLGDGSRCPALRGASSALPEESRSGRSGAETGRVVVQARGSWQRYGARGGGGQREGVAPRRCGGKSWRRGVAGEHAARGHCLTGIEPLRGSTTSFSVTSGARPPASRPRWPLSAPLIASAPVPAPALFLRHVPVPAPGASLSPLPARPCSRSRLLSPLHSGRPLLPYLRKKNSGPPKRGVRS